MRQAESYDFEEFDDNAILLTVYTKKPDLPLAEWLEPFLAQEWNGVYTKAIPMSTQFLIKITYKTECMKVLEKNGILPSE
jgi:hypothetical protein